MNGIERVKGRLGGKPVIEGTRLTTSTILSCFLSGWTLARIATEYPSVTPAQIEAALRFECCAACKCPECAWARDLSLPGRVMVP